MGAFFGAFANSSAGGGGAGGGFAGAYLEADIPAVGPVADFNPGPAATPPWPGTLSNPYGRVDLNPQAGDTTLSSMVAGLDGQEAILRNINAANMLKLNNQDAAGAPENRFAIGPGEVQLSPGNSVLATYYAGTVNRWVIQL